MLRKWVGAAGAALALQPGAVVAQGALGANFNEHYEDVDYRELDSAGAQWIRLFLPMPQVDRGAAEHGAIRTTLEAGARGYKTIFTLKWPQNDRRSEEHTSELQSLMRISYAVFCLNKNTSRY